MGRKGGFVKTTLKRAWKPYFFISEMDSTQNFTQGMKKLGQFTAWFSNYIDLLFSPNKPTIDQDVEIFSVVIAIFSINMILCDKMISNYYVRDPIVHFYMILLLC